MTSRLAIEGGVPVRDTVLRPWPTWPVADETDAAALLRVLHSGAWWSGSGEEGTAFAREFAAYQAAAHGICCASGTVALEAALRALAIGNGDEVICPAYTFVATASAVLAVGAVPVWADIQGDTLNLDPKSAAAQITPRTAAIIAVHVAGRPADLDALTALAECRNLLLIEDAAQAHGAAWCGKPVGAQGRVGTFSFQASKNLNAGEGGFVVTNDTALADRIWSVCNVGHLRTPEQPARMGTNFRLSEFQAALLRTQLARLPEQTATRQQNAARLRGRLASLPAISLPLTDLRITTHANHLFPFRLTLPRSGGKTRDDFLRALAAEGVPASSGYVPQYRNPLLVMPGRLPATRSFPPAPTLATAPVSVPDCPVCEAVCADTVWLPQHLLLGTEADTNDIGLAIQKIVTAWSAPEESG